MFATNVEASARVRGYSQAKLARATRASRRHLGRVLDAKCNVGLDLVSRIGWSLGVECASLFAFASAGRSPTCRMRARPEDLGVVVAANTRRALRLRFGDTSVAEIAAAISFERSGLYDVLAAGVDISVTRLARLATCLGDEPARLLTPAERRPLTAR